MTTTVNSSQSWQSLLWIMNFRQKCKIIPQFGKKTICLILIIKNMWKLRLFCDIVELIVIILVLYYYYYIIKFMRVQAVLVICRLFIFHHSAEFAYMRLWKIYQNSLCAMFTSTSLAYLRFLIEESLFFNQKCFMF